ncbi:MAG: glycosyltransferase, partial [Terriglobales bacterium]
NEGIDWANADYFMNVDADDFLAPGCLKRALSIMNRDPSLVFCHGREECLVDNRQIPDWNFDERSDAEWKISSGEDFIKRQCTKGYNLVANPTVVRRTRIQKSAGHFYADLNYADDMNMWLRLALHGNVAETSAVQGIRRVHPGQLTQSYREAPVMDLVEHLNNFEHFFCHEGTRLPNAGKHRATVTRRIAFNGLYAAGALMMNRRLKQSLRCVQFSLRTYAGFLAQ